jgi:hypothetical protein
MDPIIIALNIIKLILPLITGIIALIAGFIELRLNSKNWLNRWFFSFFISASLGYLIYSVYHIIIFSPAITSIAVVITQIFFNFIPISLIMTVFVLEKFPKKAMSPKYLGTMLVIFILMSFGYFWWTPRVDPDYYTQRIINTTTPLPWFVFVNFVRMVLFGYALFEYAMITKKTEGEAKQRMRWFFIGIVIIIIGLLFNLFGGILNIVLIEILALILFNLGAIIIVKGFII